METEKEPERDEHALSLLQAEQRIPRSIVRYASNCLKKQFECPLLEETVNLGQLVVDRLVHLLIEVSEVLGCTIEELPARADFDPNDIDPSRYDSFIGELRTVVALHRWGFKDINLLPARKDSRSWDIEAIIGGQPHRVEVRTLDSSSKARLVDHTDGHRVDHYRLKDGNIECVRVNVDSGNLCDHLWNLYEDKRGQLPHGFGKADSARMLTFVINQPITIGGNTETGFLSCLRQLHERAGFPGDLHFSILTFAECVVWPPLPD